MFESSIQKRSVAIGVLVLVGIQVFVFWSYYGNRSTGPALMDEAVLGAPTPTDCPKCPGTSRLKALIAELEQEKEDAVGAASRAKEALANKEGPTDTKSAKSIGDRVELRGSLGSDPLDDESALAGFPGGPVSLKDLALCDHRVNIVLKGHWKCEQDPSCVACNSKTIEKYKELVNVFDELETKKARMKQYEERFGYGSDANIRKSIVVSAVNYGQLYLFLNWACSCERIGIDPREFTVIAPTDEETASVLRKMKFFIVEPATWAPKLSHQIGSKYTGAANSGPHAAINNVLFLACTEILVDLGHNVLLHDVDIAWNEDTKGGLNTGFIYARNTRKSRTFFKTLKDAAQLKTTSDQELFNMVLRNRWFSQMEYRTLPQDQFYKYSGRRAAPPKDARIYHAVGNHKRSSFIFHNMWFFEKSCSYYDGPADEAALATVQGDFDLSKGRKPGLI